MGESDNTEEIENPCETTKADVYVSNSGSRGFRGQRSRRSRSGRVRNRGLSASTQHDTGYGTLATVLSLQRLKAITKLLILIEAIIMIRSAEQKQCDHCGQFGHLKRECPSIFCELCGQKCHGSQQSEQSQNFQ